MRLSLWPVENLTAAIKDHLMPKWQTGHSKEGILTELNKKALAHASLKHSAHHWKNPAIPWSAKITAWKNAWSLTWNRKKACQCQRGNATSYPNGAQCPICPLLDGVTHIFGGCQHKDMKAHYISRHNKATALIHKALSHSVHGGLLQHHGWH